MTAPMPGPPPGRTAPVSPRPGEPQERSDADPSVALARAMAGLDGLDGRPLPDHVEAFERVHAALGDALAAGSG